MILDISSKNEHLLVGLHTAGATVQSYEETVCDRAMVLQSSRLVVDLIERNSIAGTLSSGSLTELKKNGQVLFDYLIPPKIKARLREGQDDSLTILIDEGWVFVPWELLFDGSQFLCLRYSTGRCVKTKQCVAPSLGRPSRRPLPMLVLADPRGDLVQARAEAVTIRETLDGSDAITVTTKTKNVYCHYVQKNLREYEILHYAGHAQWDANDPSNSGWLLTDGALTGRDFSTFTDGSTMPQLVFMNACRSAASLPSGDHCSVDGLFGLANALLTAGARFVIGALARVEDRSAARLAGLFYEQLAGKERVGLALCRARRELRERSGEDDLSWAAYVLYGDPSGSIFIPNGRELVPAGDGTVAVTSEPRRRWVAAVAAGIIVGGSLWVLPRWQGAQECRQGIRLFTGGDYRTAVVHFEQALRCFPDDVERSRLYEFSANAASLADDWATADERFEKAADLAARLSRPQTAVRLAIARADNIRLAHLRSAFVPGRNNRLSLTRARELYEQADQEAGRQSDAVSAARAQTGLGRLARMEGDRGRAIHYYRSAVEHLEQLSSPTIETLRALSQDHLELAGLYIDPQLDFKNALDCVVKADKGVREMIAGMPANRSAQEYRDSFTIFLRRLESLLYELSQKGYENSEFYRTVGQIYDQLRILILAK